MEYSIRESDWKIFRELHEIALQRFCERALGEVGALLSDAKKTPHERYLAMWKLMRCRDKGVAQAFNDFRRSTAETQLAIIQRHELLTEEEMSRFSDEMRQRIALILSFRKDPAPDQ